MRGNFPVQLSAESPSNISLARHKPRGIYNPGMAAVREGPLSSQSNTTITAPPTYQKSYPKFWNPRATFENIPLCPPKYIYI
jgi:hypothetical protein